MIIKAFFGKHIDLSKIIAVSDVQIDHHNQLYFTIDVQLRDEPLTIYRQFEPDEIRFVRTDPDDYRSSKTEFAYVPKNDISAVIWIRSEYTSRPSTPDGYQLLALRRRQDEVDDLVAQWRLSH